MIVVLNTLAELTFEETVNHRQQGESATLIYTVHCQLFKNIEFGFISTIVGKYFRHFSSIKMKIL